MMVQIKPVVYCEFHECESSQKTGLITMLDYFFAF